MALIDQYKAIRDNLVSELEDETARRVALTAAGNPPPTTYQVAGKAVHWNEYLAEMTKQIEFWNGMVISADDPYEEVTRGYT